jgi:NADH dehydrogenase [ubiquinone] 1 alpha subcomplex assembly factor 1
MTAVFHGNLSTFSHDPNRRMGYAAIQSQLRPIRWLAYGTVSLEEFDYLSLRLRGDGRTYVVNIQVPGFISEDMFQCFIYTKKIEEQSNDWQEILVNFEDFIFTYKGFVQTDQAPLPKDRIQKIGILLADKQSGPFKLELESIRGKNVILSNI